MKRTKRSLESETKIKALMDRMMATLSFEGYMPWDSHALTTEFRVGGGFPSALKDLGAIKTTYGKVMLMPKFETLRPSTVRRKMNEMVQESVSKRVKPKPENIKRWRSDSQIDALITAAKVQARKELMEELFSKLTSTN